jgi:hypothetical protein
MEANGIGSMVSVNIVNAVPHGLVTVYVIVAVPGVEPAVTKPVVAPIVTPPEAVHVPPGSPLGSVYVTVLPVQIEEGPTIAPALGNGSTVTTYVATAGPQGLPTLYEIVAVPGEMPVTTPPLDTTAVGSVVDQTPGPEAPVTVSNILACAHTVVGPDITPATGAGRIRKPVMAIQPAGEV